jgi:hypothetical protein
MTIFGSELRHNLQAYIPDPYLFYAVLAAGLLFGIVLAGYLGASGRALKNRLPRS